MQEGAALLGPPEVGTEDGKKSQLHVVGNARIDSKLHHNVVLVVRSEGKGSGVEGPRMLGLGAPGSRG